MQSTAGGFSPETTQTKWCNLHETGLQLGRPDFVRKDFEHIWRRHHHTLAISREEPRQEQHKAWRRARVGSSDEIDAAQDVEKIGLESFDPIPTVGFDPEKLLADALDSAVPASKPWVGKFREMLLSDHSTEVYVYMFWLIFLLVFRPDAEALMESTRQALSERFARLNVFAALPPGFGGCRPGAADLLRRYPLVLSEGICAGFKQEFPDTPDVRRSAFAERVYRIVSQELNGFSYHQLTIDGFRSSGFHQGKPGSPRSRPRVGNAAEGPPQSPVSPPASLTTTALSPFFQRQCKQERIFTQSDPGRRVRFLAPLEKNEVLSRSLPSLKKPQVPDAADGGRSLVDTFTAGSKPAPGRHAGGNRRGAPSPETEALQLTEVHNRLISSFMGGRPRVVLAEMYAKKRRDKEKSAWRPPACRSTQFADV